jgi:hypothetical protein
VRVYAESNFVLEIVLAQEQHAACKDLVSLAERHEVELVLPAFSIFEPYTTIERRKQERHSLRQELERELMQLRRTRRKRRRVLFPHCS